jgi:hypothetical protein
LTDHVIGVISVCELGYRTAGFVFLRDNISLRLQT